MKLFYFAIEVLVFCFDWFVQRCIGRDASETRPANGLNWLALGL